jgi:hypothetical protein
MRCMHNIFKETYKSSLTFTIREDMSRNGYYFIEHRVVQTKFPWLQHTFHVKVIQPAKS